MERNGRTTSVLSGGKRFMDLEALKTPEDVNATMNGLQKCQLELAGNADQCNKKGQKDASATKEKPQQSDGHKGQLNNSC